MFKFIISNTDKKHKSNRVNNMVQENTEDIFKDNPFEDTKDCKTGRGGEDDYRLNDDYKFDEEEVRVLESFKTFEEFVNYIPKQRAPKFYHPNRLKEIVSHLEKTVYENDVLLGRLRSNLKSLEELLYQAEKRVLEFNPDPRPHPYVKESPRVANILFRHDWRAKPRNTQETILPLELPIRKVNITFKTKTKPCYNQYECTKVVQDLQACHMESGLPDIAHNFLVAEDGHVYEGRGWALSPHIESYKAKSKEGTLDIAFVGGWSNLEYPFALYDHALALIDRGTALNIISEQYRLYDFDDYRQRDWDPTKEPVPFGVAQEIF